MTASPPKAGNGLHDALVVSGNKDPVDELRSLGALIDPLDHGFVLDQGERLSGKPGGTVTGRNDGDDVLVGFHRIYFRRH